MTMIMMITIIVVLRKRIAMIKIIYNHYNDNITTNNRNNDINNDKSNNDSGKNIPENDDDRNNNRQAHLQYAICMHSFFQWKCKYEVKKIKQYLKL